MNRSLKKRKQYYKVRKQMRQQKRKKVTPPRLLPKVTTAELRKTIRLKE